MSGAPFAISTYLFHPERLDREHLVHVAAHDFGAIELFALRSHFDYWDPNAVERLAEWLDDTRLQLAAVHAPIALAGGGGGFTDICSIASTRPGVRAQAVDEIRQTLEISRVLPFRQLVVHLGVPDAHAPAGDNDLGAARQSLERIVPMAVGCGVDVALEVMANRLSTPDALVECIEDVLESPDVGICLDVGHARLLGDPVDAIETASGHIVAAHVHDTRGARDEHLVPYDGSIDWARALLAFQKVGYLGPWTFELAPGPAAATLARAAQARQRFEQRLGLNDELMSQ
ncbi:MAG: sugar phosphate isomerase/epimerase family protein [Vicinamibacterales bacterium]